MASKDNPQPVCMICLAEGARQRQGACGCQIVVHEKCYKEYAHTKNPKCLICRQALPYEIGSVSEEQRERDKRHNTCILCCCCCLMAEFVLQFV